jgi:hypothetical protein
VYIESTESTSYGRKNNISTIYPKITRILLSGSSLNFEKEGCPDSSTTSIKLRDLS